MRTPELQPLRRTFGIWVKSLLRRKAPGSSIGDINQITDIMEADSMLAERIEGWFDEAERRGVDKGRKEGLQKGLKKGRQEGLHQGLHQGEATALRRLLHKRFGDLSPALEELIDKAPLEQIDSWLDQLIDASSLDDIFRDHDGAG